MKGLPPIIILTNDCTVGWSKNLARDFPEPNPRPPIATGKTRHAHRVTVEDELALAAIGHLHRLSAAPADFQHGAEGTLLRSANGARSHHVPGIDVATVDRVVRQVAGACSSTCA